MLVDANKFPVYLYIRFPLCHDNLQLSPFLQLIFDHSCLTARYCQKFLVGMSRVELFGQVLACFQYSIEYWLILDDVTDVGFRVCGRLRFAICVRIRFIQRVCKLRTRKYDILLGREIHNNVFINCMHAKLSRSQIVNTIAIYKRV